MTIDRTVTVNVTLTHDEVIAAILRYVRAGGDGPDGRPRLVQVAGETADGLSPAEVKIRQCTWGNQMRLSMITEGSFETLSQMSSKDRVHHLKDALAFMPKKKVQHSLRVGATAAKAGLPNEDVEAAILHDYIERGGDLSQLDRLKLNPKTLRIIRMLSLTEKTPGADDTADVQRHIEEMLHDPSLDQHDKNIAIIVKCADRIDNLKKRLREKKLTPDYRSASLKLFNTLTTTYRGDHRVLSHVKQKIAKVMDKAHRPSHA